jgi:hypothetical protein
MLRQFGFSGLSPILLIGDIMSKTKTPTAQAVAVAFDATPSSFKDAAYKAVLAGESLNAVARWVNEKCPTFLEDKPAEVKEELKAGFALRWQELNPAVTYDSLSWVPNEKGNTLVTLDYCLSYSQQAFGQLKTDQPVLHGIIGPIRTRFSKFVSNKTKDIEREVRRIQNEGKPRERVQAKGFMKKRCKTAQARNDEQAVDEVKLRVAIDAFYDKIK